MSVYPLVLGVTVIANLGLAGLVLGRTRRALPRAALFAFLLALAAAHAILIGRAGGTLSAAWVAPHLGGFVLAHAALASFTILFLHGEPIRKRVPTLLAIIAPGLTLTGLGAAAGWKPEDTFQPSTDPGIVILNGYLVACLAVALAESLAGWRRSKTFRRESLLLVAGTLALIIGGPIYSFELVVLGVTDLLGANLAAPIAGTMLAFALFRTNPLPFRGRRPEPEVQIPWTIPPGTYLVEETRPKCAEAMILSARDAPGLALVSELAPRVPSLVGVELARLPTGERCPSVLGTTSSEFLRRHPNGTVLIDDLSYAVANGGVGATTEALVRVVRGRPETGRIVVSLSLLTDGERETVLRHVPGTKVSPPDFEIELGEILTAHLGGSKDYLERAARACRKRVEDLTLTDLPELHDHWLTSLADLRSQTDEAVQAGWGRVSEALGADLDALWQTPPTEPRPIAHPAAPLEKPVLSSTSADGFSLVRASDVLTDPPVSTRGEFELKPGVPLGAAVHEVFLGSLGPAGETVYRHAIGALHKEPGAIGREDLGKLAKLAEEALFDFGQAIDLDAAKRDLFERKRQLILKLEGLARGTP